MKLIPGFDTVRIWLFLAGLRVNSQYCYIFSTWGPRRVISHFDPSLSPSFVPPSFHQSKDWSNSWNSAWQSVKAKNPGINQRHGSPKKFHLRRFEPRRNGRPRLPCMMTNRSMVTSFIRQSGQRPGVGGRTFVASTPLRSPLAFSHVMGHLNMGWDYSRGKIFGDHHYSYYCGKCFWSTIAESNERSRSRHWYIVRTPPSYHWSRSSHPQQVWRSNQFHGSFDSSCCFEA